MSINIEEMRKVKALTQSKEIIEEYKTTKENGVLFLEKPQKVNLVEFASRHIGCDLMIQPIPHNGYEGYLVAYAESANDNESLREATCQRKGLHVYINIFEDEKDGAVHL